MAGIISDTSKSAKQVAQQMAKQIAREPLEILKDAGNQVVGQKTESQPNSEMSQSQTGADPKEKSFQPDPNQSQVDLGRIKELEEEIQKITQERTVVKNQKEAQEQRQRQAYEQGGKQPLVEPTFKRKRGLFAGMGQKLQAKKQQQRVERPMDPGQ